MCRCEGLAGVEEGRRLYDLAEQVSCGVTRDVWGHLCLCSQQTIDFNRPWTLFCRGYLWHVLLRSALENVCIITFQHILCPAGADLCLGS